MQTISAGITPQEEIDRLTNQHRALKSRLGELDRRLSLTSAERVERIQLKKMKLLTKDRIMRLRAEQGAALAT